MQMETNKNQKNILVEMMEHRDGSYKKHFSSYTDHTYPQFRDLWFNLYKLYHKQDY